MTADRIEITRQTHESGRDGRARINILFQPQWLCRRCKFNNGANISYPLTSSQHHIVVAVSIFSDPSPCLESRARACGTHSAKHRRSVIEAASWSSGQFMQTSCFPGQGTRAYILTYTLAVERAVRANLTWPCQPGDTIG